MLNKIISLGKKIQSAIKFSFNKLIYFGNNVYCPVCESSFRVFGKYGYNNRPNAKCFQCGSLERHRLLWIYLTKEINIQNHSNKILHFAPQEILRRKLSQLKNINYVPCDLHPEHFNKSGSDALKVCKVDITNICFQESFFDLIMCSHILEHVEEDIKAMKELFRVLKTGGIGLIQVPIDLEKQKTFEDYTILTPEGKQQAFGHYDHVRIYGKDISERLKRVGFKVTQFHSKKNFTREMNHYYGLETDEILFICTKG